ncbi:RNA-binding cell elongation regulator Jag/EloR [Murdochiella massiliensis]|uniref:RNA-binding cell elongation regulator Jag/EloR n=1 Tax=Murdochiella massiliensis TaxID=1673723 RepID=UPI0008317DAF|nr:RNA-binding cell elongation regulator Jag/EloR [Murdochiella massiliensis]
MQSVVKTGKTVDEAVQAALEALDASLDEVSIEIMEEAKSGFLGVFGSKEAVVRVSRKESGFRDLLEDNKPKEEKKDVKTASPKMADEKKDAPSSSVKMEEKTENPVSAVKEKKSDVKTSAVSTEKNVEAPTSVEKTEERKQETPKPLPRENKETEKPTHSLLDRIHEEVEREQGKKEIALNNEKESETSSPLMQASSTEDKGSTEDNASVVSTPVDNRVAQEHTVVSREMDNVEIIRFTENWLSSILEEMHISAQLNFFIEEENLRIELTEISETDMGIVIGRRAETLNAIQYLLGVTLNRISKRHYRVYLDVGDYRKRRAQNITRLAERNAEKVKRSKRSLKLEPMNAYERRIVHTALQNMEHIETVSEGREPHRKVVILYKE